MIAVLVAFSPTVVTIRLQSTQGMSTKHIAGGYSSTILSVRSYLTLIITHELTTPKLLFLIRITKKLF